MVYLCLLSFFQSVVLAEKKFVFLKQRLHGNGEKDRAGVLFVASTI